MAENTATSEMLLNFLHSYDVAVLATIKPGNISHAATIYYYVDDNFNFYFVTKNETSKFKNIENNHSVSLVITDSVTLQTIQVEGNAEEVDYTKEYAPMMAKYNETLSENRQEWDKIPLNHVPDSGYFAFVKVTPTWIRWSDYKNWEHIVKFDHKFS